MDKNIYYLEYDEKKTVSFEWVGAMKEEWRALQYDIESFFQRENIKTDHGREYDRECERKVVFVFWCKDDALKYKNYLNAKFNITSKFA